MQLKRCHWLHLVLRQVLRVRDAIQCFEPGVRQLSNWQKLDMLCSAGKHVASYPYTATQ